MNLDELTANADWIKHAKVGYGVIRFNYSPDQPRVPAGSPEGGQWTSGGAPVRTFDSEQGYQFHETGPVADWVRGLDPKDPGVRAISGYAGFGYTDINPVLRGRPILKTERRKMTEAEIATFGQELRVPRNPNGKESVPAPDGGRFVFSFYGGGFTHEREVPDTERNDRAKADAAAINHFIETKGYVLPEAIEVKRYAFLKNVTEQDVLNSVGTERTELGFTSTMVGTAQGRFEMGAAATKADIAYRQTNNANADVPGVGVNFHIILPAGTRVASVEAIRRMAYDELSKKDYRVESELLLGSGARFKVRAVRAASTSTYLSIHIPVMNIELEYVGGGTSAARS